MKKTAFFIALILVLMFSVLALSGCGVDTSQLTGSASITSEEAQNNTEETADYSEDLWEDEEDQYEEDYDEVEEDASDIDEDDDFDGEEETIVEESEPTSTYVLNTNTKKFHYEYCRSVDQMKDKNKRIIEATRDEIIEMGYDPCGNCNP
ncbi:MAG: hypothetical protein IJG48_02020 [Mogibacterium sp.]|nr:hypothetical protein [Mogibacterium sp.]